MKQIFRNILASPATSSVALSLLASTGANLIHHPASLTTAEPYAALLGALTLLAAKDPTK